MGKVRLLTIVLAGITVGVIAVQIQRSSVPLTDRVVSPKDGRRNAALRAFSERPMEEREQMVDRLLDEKIASKDPAVRRHALYAVRKSGVTSPRIVHAMITSLNDEDAGVQEEARAGMSELGESAVPAIIQVLGRQRSGRHELTTALSRALTVKSIPLVTQSILKGNDLQVRGIVGTLAMVKSPEVREAARETIPALAKVSASTNPVTSGYATHAIINLNPTEIRAVPGLLRMVQDNWDHYHIRGYEASAALAGIPAARDRSAPVLRRVMLKSNDGYAERKLYKRPYIALQLEKLDPRSRAVRDLTWDLKSQDAAIRYRAVVALSTGTAVNPALARPLVAALDDPDPNVASRALVAIFKMGVEHLAPLGAVAYPKIIATIERIEDEQVENFAVVAGSGAAKIGIPLLPSVFRGVRLSRLRLETANFLLSFYGGEAIPFLQALMTDQSPQVRLVAAIALARLAPTTPGIERELQRGEQLKGAARRDWENARRLMGRL